jgi:hypothetical protein
MKQSVQLFLGGEFFAEIQQKRQASFPFPKFAVFSGQLFLPVGHGRSAGVGLPPFLFHDTSPVCLLRIGIISEKVPQFIDNLTGECPFVNGLFKGGEKR